MARFLRFHLAVLACLVCTPAAPAQSGVDALGDPLPKGARARLGTTRMRHFSTPDHYCSGLGSLAWSPDGKKIATTSYGDKIGVEARLWEAATGRPLSLLENNLRYGPSFVRFAPDNRTIAAAAGNEIILWDTATGKELGQCVGHKADVDALVFQDGGKTMVSVSRDGAVLWWDVAGRKSMRQWQLLANDPKKTAKGEPILQSGIRHACFSADGKILALNKWWATRPDGNYSSNMAIVFDVSARKEMWREDIQVYDCRFAITPDGKRLAVAWAGSFSLQETATGRKLPDTPLLYALGMEFSPDGKTLAICTSGKVCFWSPGEKTPLREVDSPLSGGGYNTFAARPAFSPDGKRLAIDRGRTFQVLDMATGKLAVSWPSYDQGFRKLAFSADGRNVFADDVSIDTATWRQRTVTDDPPWKSAYCLDADCEYPEALFHRKTGRPIARLDAPKRKPGRCGDFFSPTSRFCVMRNQECEGKETTTVFAVPSGKRLWQECFQTWTNAWCFCADESRVAFGERQSRTIQVRDTATGKILRNFGISGSSRFALSPSGNLLAIWMADSRNVHIWDLRTGNHLPQLILDQHARYEDFACLLWSADNRMLAVGGLDNTVRLWEVASAQVRRDFRGHLARATCLAFSPDRRTLASGSEDTTLLIWKILPDKKHRRPFTENELLAHWESLAADASKAYQAQADLLDDPEKAVPFLAKRLQPAPTPDPKQTAALINDLGNTAFRVRAKATKQLENLGELASGAVRKALAEEPSLETRRRLESLLKKVHQPTPSQLRSLRALELLETVATQDALRIIERLAQGNPDCQVTAESRSVAARMKNKN